MSGTLIEKRSIDYVPLAERPRQGLAPVPVWFSGDAHLATSPSACSHHLGGNLLWTSVAVVAGCLLGTFFMAFHSTQGRSWVCADDPVAAAVRLQRRAAGVGGSLVAYIGFNAFNQVLAARRCIN